jgi:hypothetical protein
MRNSTAAWVSLLETRRVGIFIRFHCSNVGALLDAFLRLTAFDGSIVLTFGNGVAERPSPG